MGQMALAAEVAVDQKVYQTIQEINRVLLVETA
jgi:hypothetical protein